ncbi:shootin-1-like [Tyto alba]|uniref:shootin-1-like n=1 Tax=Tyto alba TaxID=56313 RepID=UPI001C671F6B|nr:shootin-1-like [Tyto alba]
MTVQPIHCAVSLPQAILESGSSEEEEEEGEEDEEAAMAQQHPPPAQEVAEAEERLAELEQASQVLLAELSALETEFEVERTCRQRAEAYAAQVKQENNQLKRLSLAPPAPLALPEEVPPEEDPDPAQCYGQQLKDLQEKISWLLAQRKDLTIQVQELERQNHDLQDQLEMGRREQQRLRAALGTSQRALKSFKRVSQIVTQDYCEAVQQLELEQDLRLHAEAFAHEMLVQKKEANRQSTILLQSAGPSAQLLAALQEVGRLTRALEEARQHQQQRVKELEEQLGRRPEPEELEVARAALAAAEDENQQLRKRLGEAEGRLAGLEEEVGWLQEKLAQDPSPPEPAAPAPPPPPPLPPPAPTVPVDPLSAIRQRKGLAKLQHSQPGADDVKARAVQEMMERIKNGVVLRPAKERGPPEQGPAASKRRSAVLELQGILGAVRRASGRRSSAKGRDGQLEFILQRRRRALDATLGPPGPPQQDREDAGAAGRPGAGDKDVDTAPSSCSPGSGDGVPFRPRAVGGLPRTRPFTRPAGGRGGLG